MREVVLAGCLVACAHAHGPAPSPLGPAPVVAKAKPTTYTMHRSDCTPASACVVACRNDDAAACTAAAEHEEADGNLSLAASRYALACDQYDAIGCARLASMEERVPSLQATWAEAVAHARIGCDAGVGMACEQVGWAYRSGRGVEEDDDRGTATLGQAIVLYEADCKAGVAEDCDRLGVMLSRGSAVPRDDDRATKLFEESCAKGYKPACADLATHGVASLDKACDTGADACNEVGLRYEFGREVPQDTGAAYKMYQAACDRSDGVGCDNLAYLIEHGLGAKADPSKAADLYQKACDAGASIGCYDLARMYRDGTGRAQSDTAAFDQFTRACGMSPSAEGGSASGRGASSMDGPGCREVADMYQQGRGVKASASKASRLYESACGAGDPVACLSLASLLETGATDLAADVPRALGLYDKACTAGEAEACRHLGDVYAIGDLVTKNDDRADGYYDVGCEKGDDDACRKKSFRHPIGAPTIRIRR